MKYMLMIVEPRGQRDTRSEDEGRALYAEMVEFGQGLAARGQLVASESLRPDSHGVRVQRRGEQASLVDGPFAEAREMVGGFFLIECDSRDEAVRGDLLAKLDRIEEARAEFARAAQLAQNARERALLLARAAGGGEGN
jgi:hypothetical protein